MPNAFLNAVKQWLIPTVNLDDLDDASQSHIDRGDLYLNAFKDYTQAENPLICAINEYSLARELTQNPTQLPHLLSKMAKAYLFNGQFKTAQKHLDKAFGLMGGCPNSGVYSPTLSRLYDTQGFLKFRQGFLPEAKHNLLLALKYAPLAERTHLHFSMAGVYLDQVQKQHSFNESALFVKHVLLSTLFLPVSNAFTPLVKSLGLLLHINLAKLTRNDEIEARLLELSDEYPGHPMIYIALSRYYTKLGQFLQAEYWLRQAQERFPLRDESFHSLIELYQLMGNTPALVETIERWLTLRPNNSELKLLLSRALSVNPEQVQAAIDLAKEALSQTKDKELMADIYFHLGHLYNLIDSLEASTLAYQASINLSPDHIESYIHLGTLYYDMNAYRLSQQLFEQALVMSPENPRILCNLGYLAWMQGHIEAAKDYYNKSISLDPTYDIALNNLGVLYLDHEGDLQKALALFDQTLMFNPFYALCHYNKGRAFSFLGKTLEAASCFKRARELNQNSQELDNRDIDARIKHLFENME